MTSLVLLGYWNQVKVTDQRSKYTIVGTQGLVIHLTLPQKETLFTLRRLSESDVAQHEKRTIVQTISMTLSAAMIQASFIDW
jgi:hypothetical protein